MSTVTLHIEGMSCGHCLNAVNKALGSVPGATIQSVQIGRAVIESPAGGPSAEELAAAVTRAGYRATAAVSSS
ncbi:MAG: cation transporter [Gemmatimonadota bacterium]